MDSRAPAGVASGGADGKEPRGSESVRVHCAHCGTTNRVPAVRLADGPKCGQCKETLLPGKPLELTGATFDRHIANTDLPLVVDFWSPWCGPCRRMAPAFEQAAARVAPGVRLAKVNTETEPELAARFGIRSIPTLVAFSHGREVARQSGAVDLPRLLAWISTHF